MGCCKSKEEDDAVDSAPTYQLKNIYYDTDGNLRCGNVANDKDEEFRQVSLGDAMSTKLKDEVGQGAGCAVLTYSSLASITNNNQNLTRRRALSGASWTAAGSTHGWPSCIWTGEAVRTRVGGGGSPQLFPAT
jgi:hypothetical protein